MEEQLRNQFSGSRGARHAIMQCGKHCRFKLVYALNQFVGLGVKINEKQVKEEQNKMPCCIADFRTINSNEDNPSTVIERDLLSLMPPHISLMHAAC